MWEGALSLGDTVGSNGGTKGIRAIERNEAYVGEGRREEGMKGARDH